MNALPTFITGNPEKAAQFARLIGLAIPHKAINLDEIQTTNHQDVVEHKVRQAYKQISKPVLVEDVSLVYTAWKNLPGPFVKFFVTADNGAESMCRMLDGFKNRRATASCVFGYYDGTTVTLFESHINGTIAQHPRGTAGYGFDRIFQPDGYHGKTAGELNEKEYDTYYETVKPFDAVRSFLRMNR